MGNGDREEISRRAEELQQEMAALNSLLEGYASKYDLKQALVAERKHVQESDRGKNRWRSAALVAAVVIAVLAGGAGIFNRQQSDQRFEDRIQAAINQCSLDNATSAQINKGNDAKKALGAGISGIQNEIDGLIAPLLNDDVPRTPEQQATYELFKQHYLDGSSSVHDELKNAYVAIDAAHAEPQSCSRSAILDQSNKTATTATTVPSITSGG